MKVDLAKNYVSMTFKEMEEMIYHVEHLGQHIMRFAICEKSELLKEQAKLSAGMILSDCEWLREHYKYALVTLNAYENFDEEYYQKFLAQQEEDSAE